MSYALAFAVIVIIALVVDRVRQERARERHDTYTMEHVQRLNELRTTDGKLATQERTELYRQIQLLCDRIQSPEIAVAQSAALQMSAQTAPKAHVSVDDDEAWARMLREQREAMEGIE